LMRKECLEGTRRIFWKKLSEETEEIDNSQEGSNPHFLDPWIQKVA
jgi:hypothetical protein